MAKSFLPTIFEHPYEIDPKYGKSVAYFSMEYAIDNSFKIYSGGLGYLSGSHMRSAHDLRQNLVGVGILWSYGYYNQIRAEDGSMATQYMRKNYPFLEDHNIKFLIHVCGAPVWVKAYFLNPETFGTAPMFFLSTDLEENDEESRNISRRLYDANGFTRIAQYVLLGKGGARLFDELGVEPEISWGRWSGTPGLTAWLPPSTCLPRPAVWKKCASVSFSLPIPRKKPATKRWT